MKDQHTPWPLLIKGDEIGYISSADDQSFGMFCPVVRVFAESNARRIVACVNALENVSTEWLEAQNGIVCLGSPIKDRFLELEKQRDELLAFVERVSRQKVEPYFAKEAAAVIAAVRGAA